MSKIKLNDDSDSTLLTEIAGRRKLLAPRRKQMSLPLAVWRVSSASDRETASGDPASIR